MSHLYGDALYYATSLFDHYVHAVSYCRPEGYYFWIYYFFMNFIWIVIPFCEACLRHPCPYGVLTGIDYLCQSIGTISRAMKSAQEMSTQRKTR